LFKNDYTIKYVIETIKMIESLIENNEYMIELKKINLKAHTNSSIPKARKGESK